MKLFLFLLNVVISPVVFVAGIYYFYIQDLRQAILLALIISTGFSLFRLFFKTLKLVFSTLTFNLMGALKSSAEILTTIGVLALYWLAYYFYWGANFALNI